MVPYQTGLYDNFLTWLNIFNMTPVPADLLGWPRICRVAVQHYCIHCRLVGLWAYVPAGLLVAIVYLLFCFTIMRYRQMNVYYRMVT